MSFTNGKIFAVSLLICILKNLILSVNDPSTTQPTKTYNEKRLEEEQKILEEKQKKLKTEHEINVKKIEDEFTKCMSKPDT